MIGIIYGIRIKKNVHDYLISNIRGCDMAIMLEHFVNIHKKNYNKFSDENLFSYNLNNFTKKGGQYEEVKQIRNRNSIKAIVLSDTIRT